MNITLTPVISKEKAQAAVAQAQEAIKASKWHKLANGEFGQSRVNEGKNMLAREERHIKQLQDIANNAPAVPTITIQAHNAYNERETLKANGFRWEGTEKIWYKVVRVSDLDSTLANIGATVTDSEKLLAGL